MGKTSVETQAPSYQWLRSAALIIALAMVITRCLTQEFLRDPTEVMPGSQAAPRGVGAAIGVALDLACCAPALLVLLHRALTKKRQRAGLAPLLFVLFAALAATSFVWATDRYAAGVGAAHLIAGGALIWAASQLVTDWTAVASLASTCLGILLCLFAQGIYYATVDLPDLRDRWLNDVAGTRTNLLKSHNWQEGSFAAKQFALKILHGDFATFYTSANTYAAMLVLLAVVVAGLYLSEPKKPKSLALLIFIIPLLWMLWLSQCKAAFVTLFLAVVFFLIVRYAKTWLIRFRGQAYALTLLLVLAVIGLAVSYGQRHGNLHNDSLNFRWRYWVASAHMFVAHPLLGVGWNNFGDHYLAFRLPAAPEEIKDPHNMFVRVFCELGIAGGTLFVVFLLISWWRISASRMPAEQDKPGIISARGLIVAAILAMAINVISSIDFAQIPAFIFIEIMRRFLFLALLLLSILFVLDPIKKQLSTHSLPWLPAAIGIGLGLFLIHNLIDFAIFDPSPGPLMVFALLIGGLIGIRSVQTTLAKFAWASFGIWLAIALMCIGAFVAPVLLADSDATQADEQFRENHCYQAAVLFENAQRLIPYNAEYPFRKAEALIYAQAPLNEVDAAVNQAIAENPRFIDAYLLRARYFQRQAGQYKSAIVAAYEKATALNPNDVGIRLEFAEFLKDSSEPQKAVEQYQKALWYNNQFPPEEAKRLSPEDVEKIQQNIAGLK